MKSMTGFGRSEVVIGTQQFSFEVKSVNHRFLDFRVRLPHPFSHWETALCEKIRTLFERGSFDVSVRVKWLSQEGAISGNTRFAIDQKALESFQASFDLLSSKLKTPYQLQMSDILRTGKILIPLEDSEENLLAVNSVMPTWEMALSALLEMRKKEGLMLKTAMENLLLDMEKSLELLETLTSSQKEKIRDKLGARLAQWKLEGPLDSQRLEWEVALLVEKSDITEEIDRLKSHFAAAREAFGLKTAMGRKLDFLIQEMHREVNTIASKAQLMEITQLTVQLKSNIEKLREQVQNVE